MTKLLYTDSKILADLKNPHESVNNDAIRYLYRQFYPMALKFVKQNKGNAEDANDVFQESLIAFYENVKGNKFRGDSTIKTYLYSTIRNNWFTKLKKTKTQIDIDKVISSIEDTNRNSETELINILAKLLEKLGSSCKKILTYYYYENFSMKDIKEKMDFSTEQSAKTQKYKCMQKLLKILEDEPKLKTTLLDLL